MSAGESRRASTLLADIRRAASVTQQEGVRGLAQRVVRAAANRLDIGRLEQPLLPGDIADSTRISLRVPSARPDPGKPLDIGWVTTPPRAGSGGHTTLFRMVEAAEAAGHRCHLFFYDRYGGDITAQEKTVRDWWPTMRAEVHDPRSGIRGVDAVVATGWETAHVIARRADSPMRHLYFIQDYEPFFYPRGALYSLAEDSYRFGFRNIALGQMVANLLESEVAVNADVTEFGCDTSVYRRIDGTPRTGVVLYARPDVPRRGFWLAQLALQEFHRRHPEVQLHLYGSVVRDPGFPSVQHGRLNPAELNALYNGCVAGLAMSFTNISLVAEEMMAAGTIPIVNDSVHSRADLANDHVAWAVPTPGGIASALSMVVTRAERDAASRAAAESVRQFGWAKAQSDVLRIIEDEVYGPATGRTAGL